MLKKLLLSVALLSSTYGSDTPFVDPDFSLLANRSDKLLISKGDGIVCVTNKNETYVLSQLTLSFIVDILSSNDINTLDNCLKIIKDEIGCVFWTCLTLIYDDSTARCDFTPEDDAAFLSQLFWNRVSLFHKILQAMLLSPGLITKDPTGILKHQHENLIAFLEVHDPIDSTPFIKRDLLRLEILFDAFMEVYNIPPKIEPSASNDPLPSDAPIPKDVSTQVNVTHWMRIPSKL
jgi:hypothetical protein